MEKSKPCLIISLLILTMVIFHCDRFSMNIENDWHIFRGKIVYNDFEGGFYGIVTDAGERFDPLNLDERYHKEGITIAGQYKERKDLLSHHMWGKIVEVKNVIISL